MSLRGRLSQCNPTRPAPPPRRRLPPPASAPPPSRGPALVARPPPAARTLRAQLPGPAGKRGSGGGSRGRGAERKSAAKRRAASWRGLRRPTNVTGRGRGDARPAGGGRDGPRPGGGSYPAPSPCALRTLRPAWAVGCRAGKLRLDQAGGGWVVQVSLGLCPPPCEPPSPPARERRHSYTSTRRGRLT